MGAFALYAIICILAVIPTPYRPFSLGKSLPALLGALVNIGMVIAMMIIGLGYGEMARYATWIAIGIALFFLIASLLIRFIQPRQKGG